MQTLSTKFDTQIPWYKKEMEEKKKFPKVVL